MTISRHLNKCNKRHAPRLRYPTSTSNQALLHRIQELGWHYGGKIAPKIAPKISPQALLHWIQELCWHYDGKIAPRVRLFVCANGRNGGDDTCGV